MGRSALDAGDPLFEHGHRDGFLPGPMNSSEHRLQRLVSFSDAVFGFAITLLAVDLQPPEVPAGSYEEALRTYLLQPAPFIATAIGFVVVGSYWMSHRSIFAQIRRSAGGLAWANTAFLFFIVIQPFFTAALASHDPNQTSVVAYSVCQVLSGIGLLALWGVALRGHQVLAPGIEPRKIRYVTIQLCRAPLAFAVSIPVTLLVGPEFGMLTWGAIIVAAVLISRAFRDIPRDPDAAADQPGA